MDPLSVPSEPSNIGSNSGDALAQLVESVQPTPFSSIQNLREALEHRREALEQNKTSDQYLVFTHVPTLESSRLSDDQSRESKLSILLQFGNRNLSRQSCADSCIRISSS